METPSHNVRNEPASGLAATVNDLVAPLRPHIHWAPRTALVSVFLFHGWEKLSGGPAGFAEMMGLSVGVAWLVTLAELSAGILLLVGGVNRRFDLATRLGALLVLPVMLGAIAMVHWPRWSFVATESAPMGGMEFQVTLVLLATYFVLKGNHA